MKRTKKRMSDAWTVLFVFGGFAAIAIAIGFYMARLQGTALELQQANPGWKVEGRYGPLRLDDQTPAGEVYVNSDDAAGASALRPWPAMRPRARRACRDTAPLRTPNTPTGRRAQSGRGVAVRPAPARRRCCAGRAQGCSWRGHSA